MLLKTVLRYRRGPRSSALRHQIAFVTIAVGFSIGSLFRVRVIVSFLSSALNKPAGVCVLSFEKLSTVGFDVGCLIHYRFLFLKLFAQIYC